MSVCLLQQGVKEPINMQALLQIEVYQKTADELLSQLKSFEVDREKYIKASRETQESTSKPEPYDGLTMPKILECDAIAEQFAHVMDQVMFMKDELVHLQAKHRAAEELKNAALERAELMETAATVEKEKNEDLLRHISELNEIILSSAAASIESEKSTEFFSGIETALEMATAAVLQSEEQVEEMQQQVNSMHVLEEELLVKTIEIDYFRSELRKAKELHYLSINTSLHTNQEFNRLRSEAEAIGKVYSENLNYIASLEEEVKRLARELGSTRGEANELNSRVDSLVNEIHCMKDEMSKGTTGKLELEIQIAELKSEAHKARSKVAGAEAAEARAMSIKSGMYFALKELALEAQEAKIEAERLKIDLKNRKGNNTEGNDPVADAVADFTTICSGITISLEEYDQLIQKAEKADKMQNEEYDQLIQKAEKADKMQNEEYNQLIQKAEKADKMQNEEYDQLIQKAEKADKMQNLSSEDMTKKNKDQEPDTDECIRKKKNNEVPEVDTDLIMVHSQINEDNGTEEWDQKENQSLNHNMGKADETQGMLSKHDIGTEKDQEPDVDLIESIAKKTEDNAANEREQVPDIIIYPTSFNSGITISVEEYESLVQKSEMADRTLSLQASELDLLDESKCYEVNTLKDELEAANNEVKLLRSSLKSALMKAELAEKAKTAIENQLRKWREKQCQRRLASAAPVDEAVVELRHAASRDKSVTFKNPLARVASPVQEEIHQQSTRKMMMYGVRSAKYIPLAKVLNMKM